MISETRIQQWQTALQSAISILNRIPAPLIYPPPLFVRLIIGAVNQINQVLTTLASIPIISTQIYPPQAGQATMSLETLESILEDLQQAEELLIQALWSA